MSDTQRLRAEMNRILDEEPGVPLRYRDPKTQQAVLAINALLHAEERRGPMHHDLKSIEPHFTNVCLGIKPMEVRRDDRDFKYGDTVTYHQFVGGELTGRKVGPFTIGLVLHHRDLPEGIQPGFCVYAHHNVARFDVNKYRSLRNEAGNAHFDAGEWQPGLESPSFTSVSNRADAADAALEAYVLACVIQA